MPPVLVMEVVREGLKSADARIKRLEIDEPFRIVAVTKAFQLNDVDPIYGTRISVTVTYRTRRGTRRYPTAGEVTLSH